MKRLAKNEVKNKIMREVEQTDWSQECRIAAIQTLIPIGLMHVAQELMNEVSSLAGKRYSRESEISRWGCNNGSVYLGDQKVKVAVPRVRNSRTMEEVTLKSYKQLQSPVKINAVAMERVIRGISMRNYEGAVLSVPETFGLSRNSVSRKWIRASAKKLSQLQSRSLKGKDFVALIIDGKFMGKNEIIIALGVTIEGKKVVLGMIESSSENQVVCRDFFNGLIERGLSSKEPLLAVVDGSKGINQALKEVFGDKVFIQRCQWHKRENVVSYLAKEKQATWRRKLQAAYEEPVYSEACKRLQSIKKELAEINISAVKSLDEGFEETLTLHRLGMFEKLGTSLKTTNLIESINSQLERYTKRVSCWKTSDQRQRWAATALLKIEPSLRKIKGHKHLQMLRFAMSHALRDKEFEGMAKGKSRRVA